MSDLVILCIITWCEMDFVTEVIIIVQIYTMKYQYVAMELMMYA